MGKKPVDVARAGGHGKIVSLLESDSTGRSLQVMKHIHYCYFPWPYLLMEYLDTPSNRSLGKLFGLTIVYVCMCVAGVRSV